MANTKITDFPNGGGVLATDQFWSVRNGLDYRVNVSSLQSLVASPALNNLLAMDATGQAIDSGIAKADVTKQGNTFNGNNQLVQTTSTGDFPALIGDNISVINPTSPTRTALSVALENIFMSIPAAQIQSDWTQANTSAVDYIKNKPTIPAAQVNADWNATSGVAEILNKPNILINPMTAAGDLIIGGTPVGGVAPPVRLQKGTVGQILTSQTTGIAWMDNPAFYLYTRYRYVDNVGGLDTNNGSYNAPYKTMKYSVENNPTGTIHVLMGQSAEAAFSIPADKTNIDIIAQGTRSALNGFTNKVTVLTTGYGSVRFQDLNFGGGLTRAATCTCGIYVYDGSIGSAGFTNSGNGYTEISQTDASNGVNNISAGTTVFYGGKVSAPSMTGTGTVVTFDNVGTVNGNAAIAAAGVTLYMFETNWAAAASGHAISCVAGTVVTMQGCNFVRPNGTLASISVANYDIQNTDFDKANSVLGTHIGNYDWYAKLGLLNADTVTTAKKMLVRKATGEIAEQAIPSQAYQFNAPAGTLYCEDDNMKPQVMTMRNASGSMQNKQRALVATSNALSQVDQVFGLMYKSGQTLVLSGKVSIYNNALITSANYNATAQVIGKTSGGQLVNLGTSTQVTLSKTAYEYNFINFSCTDTTSTNIVAVGVRITIQYPQANDTAIVDTMYIQATVS